MIIFYFFTSEKPPGRWDVWFCGGRRPKCINHIFTSKNYSYNYVCDYI